MRTIDASDWMKTTTTAEERCIAKMREVYGRRRDRSRSSPQPVRRSMKVLYVVPTGACSDAIMIAREDRGWTRGKLARLSGVDLRLVETAELAGNREKVSRISMDDLRSVCLAVGVELDRKKEHDKMRMRRG